MACNFTISASETSHEFDWIGGTYSFDVIVDNNANNNSYYIENEYLYDWFSIERNRNTLIVRVNPYFEYDNGDDEDNGGNPRNGYIRLVHNCVDTATIDINITQRGVKYDVSANVEKKQLTLPPLEDSKTEITVTTYGGSEKFYVKSVKEYSTHTIKVNGVDEPVEMDYDNAFKLSIEDDKLIINSYGRPFIDEGCFYEITLAHRDYRFTTDTFRIYYEEPTEKKISVSPSAINFDYHGIVTNDDNINYSTITLICDGEEIPDYGYTYELNYEGDIIDEDEFSWLTITENPTSLSFECEQNCDTEARTAEITVYEYTDEEKGDDTKLTITQGVNENCSIVPTQSIITVPTDASGETYQTTFKVYGKSKKCSGVSIEQGEDWIEIISNPSTDDNGAYCLYTLYTLTFQILSENGGEDRTATITINHADGASATMTIIQLGIEQSKNGLSDPTVVDDNTISVIVNPATENPQISILTTGNWCKATVTDTAYDPQTEITTVTITVSCDDNHWNTERTCRLTLSNANNPNNELYYLVTQDAEGNITIA